MTVEQRLEDATIIFEGIYDQDKYGEEIEYHMENGLSEATAESLVARDWAISNHEQWLKVQEFLLKDEFYAIRLFNPQNDLERQLIGIVKRSGVEHVLDMYQLNDIREELDGNVILNLSSKKDTNIQSFYEIRRVNPLRMISSEDKNITKNYYDHVTIPMCLEKHLY